MIQNVPPLSLFWSEGKPSRRARQDHQVVVGAGNLDQLWRVGRVELGERPEREQRETEEDDDDQHRDVAERLDVDRRQLADEPVGREPADADEGAEDQGDRDADDRRRPRCCGCRPRPGRGPATAGSNGESRIAKPAGLSRNSNPVGMPCSSRLRVRLPSSQRTVTIARIDRGDLGEIRSTRMSRQNGGRVDTTALVAVKVSATKVPPEKWCRRVRTRTGARPAVGPPSRISSGSSYRVISGTAART